MLPTPITCTAVRCAHCGAAPPGFKSSPRALTDDDLRWLFGAAASAVGIRSTHGAFVDMAMSGIQPGGRTNGVEARAVDEHRLRAVARERCLTARLAHVPPGSLTVLRALYGLDHWTTAPELSGVRAMLQSALGELADVAPLTAHAIAAAEHRRTHPRPIKPPKDRPSQRGKPSKSKTPSEIARDLLHDDPALAGSPRGAVLAAVASEDKTPLRAILREAAALRFDARRIALVTDAQPPRRIRAVTHSAGERCTAAPEPFMLFDGEALAGG